MAELDLEATPDSSLIRSLAYGHLIILHAVMSFFISELVGSGCLARQVFVPPFHILICLTRLDMQHLHYKLRPRHHALAQYFLHSPNMQY